MNSIGLYLAQKTDCTPPPTKRVSVRQMDGPVWVTLWFDRHNGSVKVKAWYFRNVVVIDETLTYFGGLRLLVQLKNWQYIKS